MLDNFIAENYENTDRQNPNIPQRPITWFPNRQGIPQ